MLAFHMRLAVWVYVYVEGHRVAADRAVFDVVLMRAPGDIHWHDDLFAAGVTDKGSFEMNGWLSAAAFGAFLHGRQMKEAAGILIALSQKPPSSKLLSGFIRTDQL